MPRPEEPDVIIMDWLRDMVKELGDRFGKTLPGGKKENQIELSERRKLWATYGKTLLRSLEALKRDGFDDEKGIIENIERIIEKGKKYEEESRQEKDPSKKS